MSKYRVLQISNYAKVGKDFRLYECKNYVAHTADESNVVV